MTRIDKIGLCRTLQYITGYSWHVGRLAQRVRQPCLEGAPRSAAIREYCSLGQMVDMLIRDYCGWDGIAIVGQPDLFAECGPKRFSVRKLEFRR